METMTSGYQGKLIGTVQEPPQPAPAPKTLFIFHEQHAQVIFRQGKHIFRDGITLNDYYGPDTCIDGAIKEAKDSCVQCGVTETSDMIIEVHLITEAVKKFKTGKKQYFHPEEDEYDTVGFSEMISRELVWSSKEGRLKERRQLKLNDGRSL